MRRKITQRKYRLYKWTKIGINKWIFPYLVNGKTFYQYSTHPPHLSKKSTDSFKRLDNTKIIPKKVYSSDQTVIGSHMNIIEEKPTTKEHLVVDSNKNIKHIGHTEQDPEGDIELVKNIKENGTEEEFAKVKKKGKISGNPYAKRTS